MLRGFATVSFFAEDMGAAKEWYTELLGIEPYFARPEVGPPAYLEFRFGDFQCELGLIDARYSPHGLSDKPAGAVIFWHVDDLEATVERLLKLGATLNEAITVRGEGFRTASVVDPFGNILGVMYNPHYLDVLESLDAGAPA
jgi:predicted enzyme related to lactoylglutathione lyase